ncbi:calcineurin-like phosphoesterase family protein [Neolewinella xylanilytica]|uniref:Calcineurin-like phosphoesterase family protein n=1 Tax=Neolewinella xylanilytica TaxID=1514080 RepID=A0A2S6I8B0_9BACT|nr:metallophosphoesterase family protein [Neolewinella xylanilytica]PPK87734.1 calcineurin-like phosphoesterase family protein [Neolewinella xylanilytica]
MKRLPFLLCVAGLLLGCSTYTPAGRTNLARAPYLQMALGDSATVLWRTRAGEEAAVAYRRVGTKTWETAVGKVRPTNTGVVENEVVLTGLVPGEPYTYRVLTDGRQLLKTDPVFPAPLADTATRFRFFAVGDIGEPEETEGTPGWLNDALVRDPTTYRFGLLLGDIVYPTGQSAVYDERLFDHFAGYFPTTPVYAVLGNHDWHEPEANYMEEWKLPGNEHYYAFRQGNVRFLALDSGANGELYDSTAQLAWLESELARPSEATTWTVVYLHHNGKSCTYKQDYPAVMGLYGLFERYNVDLVLNGHAHTYERLRPMDGNGTPGAEGFTSITIGSGGKLRGTKGDPTPYTPDPENCRHPDLVARAVHDWVYLGLSVEGDTIVGTAYRTRDNAVVDTFSITR